jgi:hypothetical protein
MDAVHLGFDMGIRNLAYCLISHKMGEGKSWTVLAWDNIDLLEGGVTAQGAKKCVCGSPAVWICTTDNSKWCKGCATGVRKKKSATAKPPFPVLPCSLTVAPLRTLAAESGLTDVKKAKKDALITWASQRYLMPWKPAKAMDSSLADVRRAMDKWLDSVLPTFASATLIRLENQPVMKGPTMKSVQIMLFTLLGHRLEKEHGWSGRIEFVHAGVKTRDSVKTTDLSGAVTDAKAYKARKNAAENEVTSILTKAGADGARWLNFFSGRSKKSDLADAFLMAMRA